MVVILAIGFGKNWFNSGILNLPVSFEAAADKYMGY